MSILEIIISSIVINICVAAIVATLVYCIQDKKIKQLKDELGETRARLYKLEQFTFELYEHFKEHLKGHRY